MKTIDFEETSMLNPGSALNANTSFPLTATRSSSSKLRLKYNRKISSTALTNSNWATWDQLSAFEMLMQKMLCTDYFVELNDTLYLLPPPCWPSWHFDKKWGNLFYFWLEVIKVACIKIHETVLVAWFEEIKSNYKNLTTVHFNTTEYAWINLTSLQV